MPVFRNHRLLLALAVAVLPGCERAAPPGADGVDPAGPLPALESDPAAAAREFARARVRGQYVEGDVAHRLRDGIAFQHPDRRMVMLFADRAFGAEALSVSPTVVVDAWTVLKAGRREVLVIEIVDGELVAGGLHASDGSAGRMSGEGWGFALDAAIAGDRYVGRLESERFAVEFDVPLVAVPPTLDVEPGVEAEDAPEDGGATLLAAYRETLAAIEARDPGRLLDTLAVPAAVRSALFADAGFAATMARLDRGCVRGGTATAFASGTGLALEIVGGRLPAGAPASGFVWFDARGDGAVLRDCRPYEIAGEFLAECWIDGCPDPD